ncbi:DUF5906 domain-containing protein [Roseibacterium beibuensis]|uniref:NrS-1 polymerase-like helicase domain-containing protein n=1 Tax=[Roseibacterium] beibuensis TaxID=1193142 RepID=A0ABP9L8N2_9RHOB|nr:DUF5906 domain-containing protein [Roseibacterium beibuensis]MCS6623893.1 DUF5906 domain-containing protein [Roseibacterium beibuensis]
MAGQSEATRAGLRSLHAACRETDIEPAYVLLRGKNAFQKDWPKLRPTLAEVLEHLGRSADNSVGVQPASLGCVVLDCDHGDGPDVGVEWAGDAHAVTTPSSSGSARKGHVWVRCDAADAVGNWKFRVVDPIEGEAEGELRTQGGQVRLNPQSVTLLARAVEEGRMRDGRRLSPLAFAGIRTSGGAAASDDVALDWDDGADVEFDELPEALRDRLVEPVGPGERSEAVASLVWQLLARGLSAASALSVLAEHCGFAVEKYGDRLEAQVEKIARDYLATREAGIANDFDDVVEAGDLPEGAQPEGGGNPMTRVVKEMNERFCAVLDGGQFQVFMEEPDPIFEGRTAWTRLSREAFRHYFEDETLAQIGEKKRISKADLWLSSPHRRKYPGIVMDPQGLAHNKGKLNLWKGWAVEPAPGDWSMMRELIGEVLCDGDAASEEYVLRWIAYMLQRPWETPEVAIAFRGEEGTGKGTLGRSLMRIAGQHGLTVSHRSQFAGRFNSHLRNCVFLFADEAVWPGDKEGEGVLKQLVTEPILSYEAKGRDITQGRNMFHMMLASNEEWIVPAGPEARRFFVSDVSDRRRQDHEYFGRLGRQMDQGGLAGMAHDLLAMDLKGWRPSMEIPQTRALADQKLRSMKPAARFWFELLGSGELPVGFDADGREIDWRTGAVVLGPQEKDATVEAFDGFLRRNQLRSERATHRALVKEGKRLVGLTTGKREGGSERTWNLPALDDARAKFEARSGAFELFD